MENEGQFKGYWNQTAEDKHDNPTPGNQELLVVRDKVGQSWKTPK